MTPDKDVDQLNSGCETTNVAKVNASNEKNENASASKRHISCPIKKRRFCMELMIKAENELCIYHQNIRSLYNKKEELSTMLLAEQCLSSFYVTG